MPSSVNPFPFESILSQYRAPPSFRTVFPLEIFQSATWAAGDFCSLSQCVGRQLNLSTGPSVAF